jgi:hypothetical protein
MNPLHKLEKVFDDDFGHMGKICAAYILAVLIRSIFIFPLVYLIVIAINFDILILIPLIGISTYLLYRWAIS